MPAPDLPRVSLIQETPIIYLPRVSEEFGVRLWMKRDDLTGFALGGNKGRKLEYLIAEAMAKNADTVVTCGAAQSNFVRQLAAACSMFGLKCAAVVMDEPYDEECGKPVGPVLRRNEGNWPLFDLLGAEVYRIPDAPWEALFDHAEKLALQLESSGRIVYRIPVGGSSPVGAFAFWRAASQIDQIFDWIVAPCSSGSTFAGIAHFLHGSPTKTVGISADPEQDLRDDLVRLAAGLDELTGQVKQMSKPDFNLRYDWVGPGYGIVTDECLSAIKYLARREGIFLDPVYSAKAFAGLLSMLKSNELQGDILFWHTGGTPTLFALPPQDEAN